MTGHKHSQSPSAHMARGTLRGAVVTAFFMAVFTPTVGAWAAVIQSSDPGAMVQMGVHDYGRLIVNGGSPVGLKFLGNNADGLVGGAEGWGLGTGTSDSGGTFAGYVNGGTSQVSLISATATPLLNPTTFESIVDSPISGARVRVTHNFHPFGTNLYEVDVTITHQSGAAVQNLFYRRLQNWQVPPNAGNEFVRINLAAAPSGVQGTFDETSSLNTQVALGGTIISGGSPLQISTAGDHGSVFHIPLGPLAVGQTKTLKLYYGAFSTLADANTAVGPIGVTGYALAQPSDGAGAPLAPEQNVFAFAFKVGNSSPVNTVPGTQQVNEGATLVFNAANTNLIEVSDESANLSVALSVTHGKLTLASTANLAFTNGDGNGDAAMTFSGPLADINTALNGLTLSYADSPDYNVNNPASPAEALVITTTDTAPVPLSTTSTIPITVNPVNDPPVIQVTSSSVNEDCLNGLPCQVAFTVAPGPAGAVDEATQTITPAPMVIASGPIWSPAGALSVTCSPGGSGTQSCTATVGLMLHKNDVTNPATTDRAFQIDATDNGGGTNTSQFMGTLSVAAVNDAPVIQITSLGPVNEDCLNGSSCQVQFTVVPGPAEATDELTGATVQTITSVPLPTAAGSTLFASFANLSCTPALPSSAPACTADFTLMPHKNDVTTPETADRTLQVTATDSGASASPNDNAAQTNGVLSVAAVNDAPVIQITSLGPVNEDCLNGSSCQVQFTVVPGPAEATDELTGATVQTITSVPLPTAAGSTLFASFANLSCTPALPSSAPACTANYTLKANKNDVTHPTNVDRTLQVTATDSGSGAAPAVNTRQQPGVLSVTPVNDAPVIVITALPDVDEDCENSSCMVTFTIRPGPNGGANAATDELLGQTINTIALSEATGALFDTFGPPTGPLTCRHPADSPSNTPRTTFPLPLVSTVTDPWTCTATYTLEADKNNSTHTTAFLRTLKTDATDSGLSTPSPNVNSAQTTGVLSVTPVNDPPIFQVLNKTCDGTLLNNLIFECDSNAGSDGYNLAFNKTVIGQRVLATDSSTHKVQLLGVLPGPLTATDELNDTVTAQLVAVNLNPAGGALAINTLSYTAVTGPFSTYKVMNLTYQRVVGVSNLTALRVTLSSGSNGTPTPRNSMHKQLSLMSHDFPVAVGAPMTIDASMLLASNFDLIMVDKPGTADDAPELRANLWTGDKTIRAMYPKAGAPIPLLRGTYRFQTGPASFEFTVIESGAATGTVDYATALDESNPNFGFLTGRTASSTLTVKGHRVSVDPRVLRGNASVNGFDISSLAAVSTDLSMVQYDKRLIPGAYQLRALNGATQVATTPFNVGNPSVVNRFTQSATERCADVAVP